MSSLQKRIEFLKHCDGDTFIEFLGQYHSAKWDEYRFYDMDTPEILFCGDGYRIKTSCDAFTSAADMMRFQKYLQFQSQQYMRGKSEICSAFENYVQLYGKKTSEVSVQTEVSLDQNKKYHGPKVL